MDLKEENYPQSSEKKKRVRIMESPIHSSRKNSPDEIEDGKLEDSEEESLRNIPRSSLKATSKKKKTTLKDTLSIYLNSQGNKKVK
jgi:hypothetical protein